MRKGKILILGTLAGLAIGAITGLLTAPEKGAQTRKQIKDKSDDYLKDLKSEFNKLRDTLARKHKSIERDAERLAQKGKSKYDDMNKDLKDVKNAASDFKHSIS